MSYHCWHVPIWYSIQSNISPNKLRVVKIGAAGSCSLKLRICLQPLLAFLIIIMLIPLQCEEERHSVKAAAATTSSCRWWCTSTTTTTATIIPLSSSRLCVPSIFCSISIYTPLLVYLPPTDKTIFDVLSSLGSPSISLELLSTLIYQNCTDSFFLRTRRIISYRELQVAKV